MFMFVDTPIICLTFVPPPTQKSEQTNAQPGCVEYYRLCTMLLLTPYIVFKQKTIEVKLFYGCFSFWSVPGRLLKKEW
jgi:hypothetical protein